jgi:very-short-patch-repair endonuclease
MIFKTLQGSTKRINKAHKYRVNWSGKSRSKIQFKVKCLLKKIWDHHVVFEEFPVAGSKMSLDFYNATIKIAVEVQGQQHTSYTPFFHGKNKANYIAQLRRDHEKRQFCEENNIKLIEIYYNDELSIKSIQSVINKDE